MSRSIKNWNPDDRPREKLMVRGIEALTDAELVALLLATGTREASALDLARQMLDELGGLPNFARADLTALKSTKGIGNAKATTLLAAFELGRRKAMTVGYQTRVTGAEMAANYLQARLADREQEVFYVLFLNRNNEIRAEKEMFRGGISATSVDPKLIFREALQHLASSIIVAHNHPSGSLTPSRADEELTRRLTDAGRMLDITVLDHIIVSNRGWYSFADQGKL